MCNDNLLKWEDKMSASERCALSSYLVGEEINAALCEDDTRENYFAHTGSLLECELSSADGLVKLQGGSSKMVAPTSCI